MDKMEQTLAEQLPLYGLELPEEIRKKVDEEFNSVYGGF